MAVVELAGPAGRLEALLDGPASDIRAAVVLAHPHTEYGGTMHTKVVYQAAKALSRIECAVLRFNFRGAGASAGSFTGGPGEMDDFRAALDFMSERHPTAHIWTAGMSFGAWVAMTVGAADVRVSTLIGIAPPLGIPLGVPTAAAAPGAPLRAPLTGRDFESVRTSTKPKFFIQGERDEICPLKEMRSFYARASEPKELVVIDGADHVFDGKTSEVADAIEDLLGDWSA